MYAFFDGTKNQNIAFLMSTDVLLKIKSNWTEVWKNASTHIAYCTHMCFLCTYEVKCEKNYL